jgi:adenosylcobinamide kinase / adenosylcobinamide-phosphate guanylyltransferase
MTRRIIFVVGGARSGKSRFALAGASGMPGTKAFIATAEETDDEMRERIERHRIDRGSMWDTYEEPLRVASLLREIDGKYGAIVLDCLTLWISNILLCGLDCDSEVEDLIASIAQLRSSSAYIVSNEVGMGVVPVSEFARRFRDTAGFLNQRVAAISDEAYLIVAGLPLRMK